MEATLKFNLPEDQEDFELATNGWKYHSVVWELDNFLRNKLKYETLTSEEYAAHEKLRTELWANMQEYNLKLY